MIYNDCETDLKHEQIWCWAWAQNDDEVQHQPVSSVPFAEIDDRYSAHNALGFEIFRAREAGHDTHWSNWEDTLVMSRLLDPSLKGGHSLAAWGERLGYPKGDFPVELFDGGYTPRMGLYCENDVVVLRKLHERLRDDLATRKFTERSITLEHHTAYVVSLMRQRGFPFDLQGAESLYVSNMQRMTAITAELHERWPTITEPRYSEKTGKRLKDKVIEFNVGSRLQIGERLALEGVTFREFTPTGRPKIDENTLAHIDHPAAQMITEYLKLVKLTGFLKSWIEKCDDDGRIYGYVNPCGAVTGRMTHSAPNLGQIPRKGALEYRALFHATPGLKLVGADAAGLELRLLAHYMQDPEFTEQVLEGDIHSFNQEKAGLPTRDDAKTFIYAFLYGAGDAKIGSIIDGNAKAGREIKEQFMSSLPKLRSLIDKVQRISRSGSLPGLDGRRLWVRQQHAALNTLLQGAGAVVMKQAMCLLEDAPILMHVHDEFQCEVEPENAEALGQTMVDAIVQAGELLELRCPMDGEYKVGDNWAETH